MDQEEKNSLLISGVLDDHAGIIKEALEFGADPNTRIDSVSILHIACRTHGSADTVRLLIEAGAYVNAVDVYGDIPLIHAAYNGKIDVMDVLIEAGADIEIKNNSGDTALDILKIEHPNKYRIWVNRTALAAALIREDSAAAGDISREPDFDI